MKVKRIKLKNNTITLAVMDSGKWVPLNLADIGGDLILFLQRYESMKDTIFELIESARANNINLEEDYETLIPFAPLSFRDFMLYEKHVINASKGFVKKFMPQKQWLIELYEKFTGKPHPKLRPKQLWYEKPIYYMGNHINFYSDNETIPYPSYTKFLDYELELGIIITSPIKNSTPEEALRAIGGFCIVNDFSARDVQLPEMMSGFGPVKAKNFANSMSGVVVTPDEILPYIDNLNTEVRVNGEVWGTGNTAGMKYSIGEVISYASLEEQILPGELIATGTIPGCCGIEVGKSLSYGDKIELSIEKIGTLSNKISENI